MARIKNIQNQKFGYSIAIEVILKYIVDNNFVSGSLLPSLKDMSDMLFNGKLKQVRMAVKELCHQGILESQRGRGIFVKNAELAFQIFNEQQAQSQQAAAELSSDIEMPYIYQKLPTIKMIMIARQEYHKQTWREIVDAFNIDSHDFEVETEYTASPSLDMKSDLFQLQSFRIKPYLERGLILDLSQAIEPEEQKAFHNNLFREVRKGDKIFGMPITAVLYGLYANIKVFSAHGLAIPEKQFSFNEFIEYVKSLALRLKNNHSNTAVIANSMTLGYYIDLAGKVLPDTVFEKIDFKRSAIRDFLKSFGEVYCDRQCFRPGSTDNSSDYESNFFIENSTYLVNEEEQSVKDNLRLITPPVNSDGFCSIVPHYICVSSQSRNIEKSLEFMRFLCSRQVAEHLTAKGIEAGRIDVDIDPTVINYYDKGVPAFWRNEQNNVQLTKINNIFRRWQLSQITLSQALDMIELIQTRKRGALQIKRTF